MTFIIKHNHVSDEGPMLTAEACAVVARMARNKELTERTVKIATMNGDDIAKLVDASYGGFAVLVDTVTGQIYRSGECMTGPMRIAA